MQSVVWYLSCVCAQSRGYVQLFMTPWTVAHQAPLSMGFSRQEYWNELLFPPPGVVLIPGIKLSSPVSPAKVGSLPLSHLERQWYISLLVY